MTRRLHRGLVICALLGLLAGSAKSQTSVDIAMADGNAQRSRVLTTKRVDAPPQQWLWETERLFRLQNSGSMLRGITPRRDYFTFPIASAGMLLFTVYVGDSYVFAIDANTGKELVTMKFNKSFVSGPAAIGQVAFFGTSTGKVYAYDVPSRTVKWTYEANVVGPSPVVDDGVVYTSIFDGGLVALIAETGAVKWLQKADEHFGRLVIKGDNLIVYSDKDKLLSFDKNTGKKQWETRIDPSTDGMAILDDQIFVTDLQGEIRAYALANGAPRWKSKKDGGAETRLALFQDLVIYGEEFGNIVALDARNGAPKWKFKTRRPCISPLVAGDTVYATCGDDYLYALDPQTGQLKWKFDCKRKASLPTFYNGVMYFLGKDGILRAAK